MSLKQVKNQIQSVSKIHKVTKAMEAVSAVKMRKSQEHAFEGRPYAKAALSILGRVSSAMDKLDHPLIRGREVRSVCIIVVASDKGLAGSLNSNILKKAMKTVDGFEKENIHVVAIGKKAVDFFKKNGYQIYGEHVEVTDDLTEYFTQEIIERVTDGYTAGVFDRVDVVYPNFISTFEQKSVARRMLPIEPESVHEMVEGIVPVRGKYADIPEHGGEGRESGSDRPYIVEPSEEAVLSVLLPVLLSVELYHAILEESASEHSARMVAMKNASDKASELTDEFTLQYNKERQALITAEVSEIISGIQ